MLKKYRLKKQLLEDVTYLAGKLRQTVDSIPDFISLINSFKDIDINDPDVQKYILSEIVKFVKKDGE